MLRCVLRTTHLRSIFLDRIYQKTFNKNICKTFTKKKNSLCLHPLAPPAYSTLIFDEWRKPECSIFCTYFESAFFCLELCSWRTGIGMTSSGTALGTVQREKKSCTNYKRFPDTRLRENVNQFVIWPWDCTKTDF